MILQQVVRAFEALEQTPWPSAGYVKERMDTIREGSRSQDEALALGCSAVLSVLREVLDYLYEMDEEIGKGFGVSALLAEFERTRHHLRPSLRAIKVALETSAFPDIVQAQQALGQRWISFEKEDVSGVVRRGGAKVR